MSFDNKILNLRPDRHISSLHPIAIYIHGSITFNPLTLTRHLLLLRCFKQVNFLQGRQFSLIGLFLKLSIKRQIVPKLLLLFDKILNRKGLFDKLLVCLLDVLFVDEGLSLLGLDFTCQAGLELFALNGLLLDDVFVVVTNILDWVSDFVFILLFLRVELLILYFLDMNIWCLHLCCWTYCCWNVFGWLSVLVLLFNRFKFFADIIKLLRWVWMLRLVLLIC